MPDSSLNSGQDLKVIWDNAVNTLSPGAKVWVFAAEPLSMHDDMIIVAVKDELTRSQLESRVRPALEQALSTELAKDIRLVVTIDSQLVTEPKNIESNLQVDKSTKDTVVDAEDDFEDDEELTPSWVSRSTAPNTQVSQVNLAEARLNPRYQFENFVIGSSNRFAHAAAVAAAEAPGKAYNPLVIHGDSGLGKTHLLHAIGHYVLNLYPSSRVRYVSSEEFVNDVINAIGDNKTPALRRKYREIDVLLVDDIQFIENKDATQEEFFHTFNALHNENKQIVMTSDRPPSELKTLEDRLRNRFSWGLQTEMLPPDLETRIAILRKKAAAEHLTAPQDVLEFIASKVQRNIRELEGALIRATAYANLNGTTVDLQLAQIVLKDLVSESDDTVITSGMIIAQTAAYSEFTIEEICGTSRARDLALARQIAMYLCRELTELSLPQIAEEFGGMHHTTVMHAERKIRKLMAEKHAVYNQVTELTARIRQQARQA
ncbi:MAG: chromosomal replication initiator protein DnaA [Actinomycetales bacterium]|nr:chromosomal replication initiator protein DnaA [Actinomycetales bacterium]